MKKFYFILILFLFSQMTNAQESYESYEVLWEKVKQFEKEALTQSALKVVKDISEKAKKEKNSPQIVKALLYSSKYAMTLEDDAQLKIVNDFKTEINKSEFPSKNILESYLANLYWQYFQQNRYRFYDRTKTETVIDSTDFRTWDLTTLFFRVSTHFKKSLENTSELQKIKVDEFKEILNQKPGSEIYRPTLFDILAHAALQFYKTNENSITRPADKFEIDNRDLLCEAYQFTQLTIEEKDATSLQSKALKIFQQLVVFHFSDLGFKALADVDIERIKYTWQNAVFPKKDQQYLEVLQNSAENLKHNEVSALYQYEIASLYHQWGNTYQPKINEEHRWKHKEALELCNAVISKYPKSRGAEKCKALKSELLSQNLQLTTEQHIPVNKPSRLLVNYKNLHSLSLSAHKISQNDLKKLNDLYPESKQLAFIKNLPVAKQWEANLKNEKDYQSHTIEILLPSLDNGQYVLLALPVEGDKEKKVFAFSPVQITDLALVETRTSEYHNFQVIDRSNGKPLQGAKLQLTFKENYDRGFLTKNFVADSKGLVQIPLPSKRWTSVGARLNYKDDLAYFGEYYINQKVNTRTLHSINYTAFMFTDRSMYRPGQPLYFKGIAVARENDVSSVKSGISVTVALRDVNYQEVAKQEFVTNEYGSFSGEFILPSNGLTGNFSLQVSSKQVNINGNANFSVEEYKRPKFETSFEPVTETYRVNDSITVKGVAKAYAGSNITDAKVNYRVKRVVYFPGWYYWSRPYYSGTPQEITYGQTVTDASGAYKISFKAIPDTSIDKKNLPTFSYEITADVTDINGETRSASTIVRVGYHALTANISVANSLDKDAKDHKVNISTTNLNGQFVPAKGSLKIYKLEAPDNVLRPRPWAAPDYKNWSKPEFKQLFPHDAYDNEHEPINWEKGQLVWESAFNTGDSKEIVLNGIKKWESGHYVIELETQDKFKQRVEDKIITNVFSKNDNTLSDNKLFDITLDKTQYTAGDKAAITLASSAENLTVTVYVEKDRNIIDTRLIHLSNNSQRFTVPVTEADLGGFAINYSFSAYNSFQSGSLTVPVPYPKTDLEIETITFRDKLQPGTDETWTFKVKGPEGERVAAELLASMYDASLDAFRGHYWNFNPIYRPYYYARSYCNAYQSYGIESFRTYTNYTSYSYTPQYYDSLDWFGLYFGQGRYGIAQGLMRSKKMDGAPAIPAPSAAVESLEDDAELEEAAFASGAPREKPEADQPESIKQGTEADFGDIAVRKNLRETAFFFPQLQTDKEGNVSFSFTTPEALTKWKLQLLAHTKTLQSAIATMETVTQKELMVIPNAPRFLREGDKIMISTKIANLTKKDLSGQAKLELVDALTGANIFNELLVGSKEGKATLDQKSFKVDSLGNTQVSWYLTVPEGIQAVQYKVLAKAGDFSDGEQNVLPVLTNRMLVTETLPMWVRSNQTKTFTLEKLKDNTSTTLKHHKLTLEITSNPAWYAVQALPYLMEYPYECNEQTFARYYANTLASHIANSTPRIREVFDQWAGSEALLSNLEKNQELKALLIQETPWLRDAQSETEQKKRIALLFDLNKMKNEQAGALYKLLKNQMSSGAWAWFKGGRANRYITQHIIAGLGHLKQLNVSTLDNDTQQMIRRAIKYLDDEFVQEYNQMRKYAKNLDDDHLSHTQIHYLYMRSFFDDIKTTKKVDEITAYYLGQAKKYWKNRSLYPKGMLALVLHRMNDKITSSKILRSLQENSITSEKLGMYWKQNTNSWYWHEAPVETQALMIEAFSEINADTKTVDNLKIWLLKNKQTNQWKSTKATTEAVYALLLQGSDWLSVTDAVEVLLGGLPINATKLENVKLEAGTGYYKTSWSSVEIKAKMADVQLTKKGEGIAWGALYWQYFEDLDKITPAKTPLYLKKKLFLKKNTYTGEELSEITSKTGLKVGDLVRVRVELRADRSMEFVHMKDMRAAGFEPINVISQYKWQDGLGYYESTKDASTNFFFDYLPKGVYVFEYDLRVNNTGDFSNGITTIQSMYAPEFSSHSEGVRVIVDSMQ